ncbi:MAG: MgtC/SapB family protein [Bacteroidales bacterium]|nr:MgtC/SapB family protein [Bacteroidales bacterium]MBR1706296.1 MgtC/SapB family protein [Bacteroidales bacterium]
MEWNFVIRLLVAGLLGGLIGLERELRAKEAGFRTHFIVALGSALFMVISQYAFEGRNFDAARVAAQVVSGIGFIGAGVIIFQKNAVRGVTTAAGLWVAAAIGLASGAGMYLVAGAATIMTALCLEAMHFFHLRYGDKVVVLTLILDDRTALPAILETLRESRVEVETCTLSEGRARLQVRLRQKDYVRQLYTLLSTLDGVTIESMN